MRAQAGAPNHQGLRTPKSEQGDVLPGLMRIDVDARKGVKGAQQLKVRREGEGEV